MPVRNYALLNKIGAAIFDKLLELRDRASAAVTTSGNNPALAFTWAGFLEKHFGYQVVVNHSAYTGYVLNTVFWTISVEASADGSNWTNVGSIRLINASSPGQVLIPLNGVHIGAAVPGANQMRVVHTITGAAGSLSYGAFLTPSGVMS